MKFNLITKRIKSLDKIDKPINDFSERYCKSIDTRTAIKSLPAIGSLLDNLLAYKGSKIIQERTNLFFKETQETLRNLGYDKIDDHFFDGEEGFYVFNKILEQVVRCKEKQKIRYFRNIFINSITLGKSDYYYKERFIDMVADLSAKHLEVLRFYYESEPIFNAEGSASAGRYFLTIDEVAAKFSMSSAQAGAFCNDLLRHNLIYDFAIGRMDYQRGRYRITESTYDFISFITLD